MRLYLKARLAFLGATLQVAADGVEGLEALAGQRPHLIVSDAVMPRMDGFEFCRQVKGHPDYQGVPFALLTSLSQNLRERALQAGADDYLSKSENDLTFRIRMRHLLTLGTLGMPWGPKTWTIRPASILVVSRSRAIHTQLQIHLSKDGIQVVGVSSTAEVLDHLQTVGADALMIDMEQGPNALEFLLGNLANDPDLAQLPILALASKTEEAHLATLELQIQDVLPKPLDGPESRHRAELLLRLAKGPTVP